MKKFIILLFIFCPVASAETFIKVDGETILQRYEGDCFRAGFCEQNNQNIQAGWVQVIREDFLNASNKYFKYSGGRVVEMNTVEKAAVDILEGQAEQERQRQAHNAIVDQAKAEVDNPTTVASLLNTCISGITTAEIRAIKGNNPRPSATDEQLKTSVKQCLDGLKK